MNGDMPDAHSLPPGRLLLFGRCTWCNAAGAATAAASATAVHCADLHSACGSRGYLVPAADGLGRDRAMGEEFDLWGPRPGRSNGRGGLEGLLGSRGEKWT
ncbi:hypothetical protein Zmor_022572 [Zophobas morio]|uniref:Uncharacterized protein n=1 Tax=Zophobas morio TaxID=2755281 RepID=A0AA38M652_9CUCU|nr:hypothetical protein Zmor_022572 [Zophobas morio]